MMNYENNTYIENPWNVGNLDEFLYFCCPECDLRDQSKAQFLQHALEQHPKAKEFLIKEEPGGELENEDVNNGISTADGFENSFHSIDYTGY